MKLKYYLRGLGIGIAVTAIIMSYTVKTEKLTDAQIKMRALELGMVEETVLAKLPKSEEKEVENKKEEDLSQASSTTLAENPAGEAEVVENIDTFAENLSEETGQSEAEEKNEEDVSRLEKTNTELENLDATQKQSQSSNKEIVERYIVIPVEKGNGSETVSRRLYNAGLVESAVQFNRFLVDNGYDRILIVGNHEIPVGSSEEEMAKILCGLQ